MDFRLTPEQTGFAQSLTELMTKADSVAVARAWADGDSEPGLALWRRLAEQGVNALMVDESAGGLGGTAVDLVVAFEVLGHQLAVGPWIESAAFLARALDGAALGALAEGTVATVALPPLVPFALDADVAEKVYLPVDGGLECFGPRSSTAVMRSVDTTRRLFSVVEEAASATVSKPLDDAFDLATLACAAELLGCGERLLADSVDYVKQRKQYGRTIGSYQAIKHQLADVRIALDFARPLVQGAAVALGDPAPTPGDRAQSRSVPGDRAPTPGDRAQSRSVPGDPAPTPGDRAQSRSTPGDRAHAPGDRAQSRSVSAAKVAAGDAAYLASRVALQMHGAIGYTAEFDLGLWINRVRALVGAWGGSAYHRGRIAEAL